MDLRTENHVDTLKTRKAVLIEWLFEIGATLTEIKVFQAWQNSQNIIVHSVEISKVTGISITNVGKYITSLIKKGVWSEAPGSPYRGEKNGVTYKTRILALGLKLQAKLESTSMSANLLKNQESEVENYSLSNLSNNNQNKFRKTLFIWSENQLNPDILKDFSLWKPQVKALITKLKDDGCGFDVALSLADEICQQLTWGNGRRMQALLDDKKNEVLKSICSIYGNPIEFQIKQLEASDIESDEDDELKRFLSKPKKVIN